MNDNFNNIGSDFDDLFDDSSAVTVDNPVDESQEKEFEIPDMDDDFGVIEEKEEENNESSETNESPETTEEPELDV